jgi:hypothetical protein
MSPNSPTISPPMDTFHIIGIRSNDSTLFEGLSILIPMPHEFTPIEPPIDPPPHWMYVYWCIQMEYTLGWLCAMFPFNSSAEQLLFMEIWSRAKERNFENLDKQPLFSNDLIQVNEWAKTILPVDLDSTYRLTRTLQIRFTPDRTIPHDYEAGFRHIRLSAYHVENWNNGGWVSIRVIDNLTLKEGPIRLDNLWAVVRVTRSGQAQRIEFSYDDPKSREFYRACRRSRRLRAELRAFALYALPLLRQFNYVFTPNHHF